jgi:hypothetical protein
MCGAIAGNTRFIHRPADCVETTGSVNTKTAPRRSKETTEICATPRSAFRFSQGSHERGQESKYRQRRETEEQAPEDKHELEAKMQEVETSGAEFKKTRGTKTPVDISQPCRAAVTTNSALLAQVSARPSAIHLCEF